MKRVVDRLSMWLAGIGIVALMIMMVTMFMDALARKIMRPIPGAFETDIGLMVVVMFIPQGFAQLKKAHVSMDMINCRLEPRLRAGIECFAAVLAICILGLLTYASWGKAWYATIVGEVAGGGVTYPVWLFRWFLPLGLGVATLQFAETAIDAFSRVRKRQ